MRCRRSGANPTSSGFATGSDAAASGNRTDDKTIAARSAAQRLKVENECIGVIGVVWSSLCLKSRSQRGTAQSARDPHVQSGALSFIIDQACEFPSSPCGLYRQVPEMGQRAKSGGKPLAN